MGLIYYSILLIITYCIPSLAQQTTSDGCFKQYQNVREKCLVEVERRTGVTQQQCTDLCVQYMPTCKAAQFSNSRSQCDLFRAAGQLPNGRKKRSPRSNSHVRFDRPPPNGFFGPPRGPPRGPSQGPQSTCPNCGGNMYTRCNGERPLEGNCPGFTYYVPTGQCQGGGSTSAPVSSTTPNLPPQATCPAGTVVRFSQIKGYQLSGNPDFTFVATNEQACVQACADNKMPSGAFSPCQSSDFNSQTSQCQIFLSAAPPTGSGTLNQNAMTNHYEKVCVDSNTAQKCPGPFLRAPQKLLVGYAETVTTASSFSDCMQLCINSQTRFNFNCLSGMFYYSETTENCILNVESATTKPDLYISENQDKVDYFEPGCASAVGRKRRSTPIDELKLDRHRNVLWVNKPDWGSWTRCDGKQRTRKRYKSCSSFNPNNCQLNDMTCDPTNRAKELADIMSEETAFTTFAPTIATTTNPSLPSTTTNPSPPPTTGPEIFTTHITDRTTDSKPDESEDKENDCEPLLKPDGSKDCSNGIRKKRKGPRQFCKPKNCSNGPKPK